MDDIILKRLLSEDGRVLRYPAKLKQRVYAIAYLGGKFEEGRVYDEREVNAVIRSLIAFDDYVSVRRDLVDYRFLIRTSDGKEYRRAESFPAVEDILALY